MQIAVGDKVRIAYEDQWFGRPWLTPEPIILLHGLGESSRAWFRWVPQLGPRLRVIRPDLPGFGASPEPAGYDWALDVVARDIEGFIDGLGIQKFHLAGALEGGAVALQIAGDMPQRALSVALFGAPVSGLDGGAMPAARLGEKADPEQMRWWVETLMSEVNPRACTRFGSALSTMSLEQLLSRVSIPTLVVLSQAESTQAVAVVERKLASIGHSRMILLPNDGRHIAACAPDRCAQHALHFLSSIAR